MTETLAMRARGPTVSGRRFRIVSIAIAAVLSAGLMPLSISAFTHVADATGYLSLVGGWRGPVIRSLLLMLFTAPVATGIGFTLGSYLAYRNRPLTLSSALYLLPLLAGGTVTAFTFKIDFADVPPLAALLHNRTTTIVWISICGMLLWQFIPCVVFLTWLNNSQTDAARRTFIRAHQLPFTAALCDVYWPQCRGLITYLFLLAAASCAAEYERAALVFRASQGTDTELFSHWLVRAYFSIQRVDPTAAAPTIVAYTLAFVLGSIAACAGAAAVLDRTMPSLLLRLGQAFGGTRSARTSRYSLIATGLLALVFLPFIPIVLRGWRSINELSGLACMPAICFPAVIVCVFCVMLSIVMRLGWPDTLAKFGVGTLLWCVAVAALGFFPPISLAFAGIYWMQQLSALLPSTTTGVTTTWWLLLAIASLPVFLPGFLATQIVVPVAELEFQNRSRASFVEVLRTSYIGRLWPVYLLFGLFLCAFMWSEYPLSSLLSGLSSQMCSPALDLALRVEGKGAEFDEAAGIVLQMTLPIAAALLCFGAWTVRRLKDEHS